VVVNQNLKKAQEFLVVFLDFLEEAAIKTQIIKTIVPLEGSYQAYSEEVAKDKILHHRIKIIVLQEVSCQAYLEEVHPAQITKVKVKDFLDGD
jgi:hypothetical protein